MSKFDLIKNVDGTECNWHLDLEGDLTEILSVIATQVILHPFKNGKKGEVTFGKAWATPWGDKDKIEDGFGNPAPADPATIYLTFPISDYIDDQVVFTASLDEMVDDFIDLHVHRAIPMRIRDKDSISLAKEISNMLLLLSKKLTDSIKE